MSSVTLNGTDTPLDSEIGREFIENCVRAGEGILDDREIAEIYSLTPVDFQNLTKDAALIRAIRTVRDRRVRTGQAAREAAQKHFVKAPGILDRIMSNENSNPRHAIEAARELRQVALPEQNNPAMDQTRFVIHIDLSGGGGGGDDVLTFDKPFAVGVDDDAAREVKTIQPNNVLPLQAEKRKRGRPRKVPVNIEVSDD